MTYKKYVRTTQEDKIKEVTAIRKALQPKQLIPKEKGEKLADPEIDDEGDYDYDLEYYENLRSGKKTDTFRERMNLKNKSLQAKLDSYQNSFPINVFPEFLRDYVLDMEKCLNAPKEYTSAGVLTAIAGAIGNKFHAQLKEGWLNAPILFTVLIGETGANKSTPLKSALSPLFEMESHYASEFKSRLAEYNKLKEEEKKEALPPLERRCILNDATMEALIETLIDNDITIYYDEFQGFLNSMNKYRNGDDMEKWLSIWSSVQIRTDRKSKNGQLVSLPFASCIGTIQPDVLLKFLATNNTNNGFNERLLYVTTDQNIATEWNNHKPNPELKCKYHTIIKKISELKRRCNAVGEVVPRIVNFETPAMESILSWQKENTKLCNTITDNELIGIYKKLENYTIRFSLILAILDFAARLPKLLENQKASIAIKKTHVDSAVLITEYFRNSAKRIYSIKPRASNSKNVNKRFLAFFDKLPDSFGTERALEVGQEMKLSERTVYNYLNYHYFKSIKKSLYEKAYEYE